MGFKVLGFKFWVLGVEFRYQDLGYGAYSGFTYGLGACGVGVGIVLEPSTLGTVIWSSGHASRAAQWASNPISYIHNRFGSS